MITASNERNDWALDTNVLITANGPRLASPVEASSAKKKTVEAHTDRPTSTTRRGVARSLLNCIEINGVLLWSPAAAQEYQSRGAINLKTGVPPVPVLGQPRATYVDHWLARLGVSARIRIPKVKKLTGAEKSELQRAQFSDRADYRFLELAQSGHSKRLVTEESHYNARTIPAIKRILRVRCMKYRPALAKCQQKDE